MPPSTTPLLDLGDMNENRHKIKWLVNEFYISKPVAINSFYWIILFMLR